LHLCTSFGKDIKITPFLRTVALVYYEFPYELTPLIPGGVGTNLTYLASFHFYEFVLLPVLVVVWYDAL